MSFEYTYLVTHDFTDKVEVIFPSTFKILPATSCKVVSTTPNRDCSFSGTTAVVNIESANTDTKIKFEVRDIKNSHLSGNHVFEL